MILQKSPASLNSLTCIASNQAKIWYQIASPYITVIFGILGPTLALGVVIIILTQKVFYILRKQAKINYITICI